MSRELGDAARVLETMEAVTFLSSLAELMLHRGQRGIGTVPRDQRANYNHKHLCFWLRLLPHYPFSFTKVCALYNDSGDRHTIIYIVTVRTWRYGGNAIFSLLFTKNVI